MSSALEDATVRVAGEPFRVRSCGSGVPLVLVHGFPLDGRMWQPQWENLADAARVIVPDLRGFGRSVVTPGVVTMRQMADDLANLLDALGITEPVVLCGLSMGGYAAFQFAQHHAGRLRALVLCDTRSAADTADAAANRRKLAAHVLEHGTEAVAEAMLPKLFAPDTAARQPQLVALVRQIILEAPPQGVAAAQEGMAQRPDVSGQLSLIAVPTLVLVGQHDAISPPAEMQAIARAIRTARYVEIAAAGHMAPLECPASANDAIRSFLAELPR